jgi:hypothetical protein
MPKAGGMPKMPAAPGMPKMPAAPKFAVPGVPTAAGKVARAARVPRATGKP